MEKQQAAISLIWASQTAILKLLSARTSKMAGTVSTAKNVYTLTVTMSLDNPGLTTKFQVLSLAAEEASVLSSHSSFCKLLQFLIKMLWCSKIWTTPRCKTMPRPSICIAGKCLWYKWPPTTKCTTPCPVKCNSTKQANKCLPFKSTPNHSKCIKCKCQFKLNNLLLNNRLKSTWLLTAPRKALW